MKTLYINTCGKDVIIKLFKKNSIMREVTISGQNKNSQFIMPTLKKVVKNDIVESIVVINGPGSFTGVRLGVTIAKTFAFVRNIPIRSITSLEECAISLKNKEKNVAITENNGYYTATFDADNKIINDYAYYSNKEFAELNVDKKYVINTEINYEKVIAFALKQDDHNPHYVNPIYVKLIEALK